MIATVGLEVHGCGVQGTYRGVSNEVSEWGDGLDSAARHCPREIVTAADTPVGCGCRVEAVGQGGVVSCRVGFFALSYGRGVRRGGFPCLCISVLLAERRVYHPFGWHE